MITIILFSIKAPRFLLIYPAYMILNKKYAFFALSTVVSACLLSACSPGLNYTRPEKPVSHGAEYVNADDKKLQALKRGSMSHWWRHIGDPRIHHDISVLLQQNYDLKQAAAVMKQAAEQVKISAGPLAPAISADLSRRRAFNPAEEVGNIFGGGGPPPDSVTRVFDTQIEASLTASWQFDLFGQLRGQVVASEARFKAAELDKEALTHSLIADLVRRRIALVALNEQLNLAQEMVRNRTHVFELSQRRYKKGAANFNAGVVLDAERALAEIQSDIPDLEQTVAEEAYALDVLLGRTPGTTKPILDYASLDVPVLDIPVGLPIELLDRRPDLRASEFRLKAENADIDVAVADLYPSFSLSGTLGFEEESGANLFNAERLIGSLITQVSNRLFEGGALRANIRLQEAQQEELAATYANNILTAISEVETALIQEKKIDQQLVLIKRELNAAKLRANTDKDRYESGIISLRDYLETQMNLYSVQSRNVSVRQEKWNARINLYLALGGDWMDTLEPLPLNLKTLAMGEDDRLSGTLSSYGDDQHEDEPG